MVVGPEAGEQIERTCLETRRENPGRTPELECGTSKAIALLLEFIDAWPHENWGQVDTLPSGESVHSHVPRSARYPTCMSDPRLPRKVLRPCSLKWTLPPQ